MRAFLVSRQWYLPLQSRGFISMLITPQGMTKTRIRETVEPGNAPPVASS